VSKASAAKTAAKQAGQASAPAPKTAARPASKSPAKAAGASVAAGGATRSAVPAPAPGAPASSSADKAATAASASGQRFSDRFGPAKAGSRPLPEPMPSPKPAVKADPKLANAWKQKSGRDLTEAELLAMPDSEYMNDKQIEFFRTKLLTQKEDLLSNAGETTEHLREDTSIVPDPADRATIEEEHALELRTRDRERKLLKKITQALARLDSGDYGFCDETGEPIGLPRLLARPTATLSLEAQQRREMKQRMFGD
jgi:DnaK suppressor protein